MVTRVPRVRDRGREFEFQKSAKFDTGLQTVPDRFNIYAGSSVALAL